MSGGEDDNYIPVNTRSKMQISTRSSTIKKNKRGCQLKKNNKNLISLNKDKTTDESDIDEPNMEWDPPRVNAQVPLENGDTTANKTPSNTAKSEINNLQTQTVNNNDSNIRKNNNRFKLDDQGPFLVFVENIDKSKRMHPIMLGKMLQTDQKFKESFNSISEHGRNRLSVSVKTAAMANYMVSSPLFNTYNQIAYIPTYLTYRQGVIKNIFSEITETEILENTRSTSKINKVTRIFKKNDSGEKIPTTTVILNFEGQNLPEHIFIYGIRSAVEPYIQRVRQCFNCLRYGHLQNQCKSPARCANCGETHNTRLCQNIGYVKCIYCGEQHQATNRRCAEFIKQKEIKRIIATNNISVHEAVKIVNEKTFASVLKENQNNNSSMSQNNETQTESYSQNPLNTIKYISVKKPVNQPKVIEPKNIFPDLREKTAPTPIGGLIKHNPYPPQPHNLNSQSSNINQQNSNNLIQILCSLLLQIINNIQTNGLSSNQTQIADLIQQVLTISQTCV